MTDTLGYGKEKRRQGNYDVLSGKETFRYVPVDFIVLGQGLIYLCSDSFREMLRSIVANGHTFEQCKDALVASAYSTHIRIYLAHLNQCQLRYQTRSWLCRVPYMVQGK